MKYPPFCDIILIRFNSDNENEIKIISNKVYNYLKKNLNKNSQQDQFKIFIPMPSPIDKIQNKYRWRIIVKGNMTKEANEVFNNCLKNIYDEDIKSTRISIDINPNSMY